MLVLRAVEEWGLLMPDSVPADDRPVEELVRKRSQWWYRALIPPLPVYANPDERRFQPPLWRWNLYIGGAGSQVSGYVNVDLFALPGVTVACSAERLPFGDGLFEVVECDAVLEHTPRPSAIVGEISRCLKPGGHVHITVPFCHPYHRYPEDYYRFSLDGLKTLVEPLEIVHAGWRTGPTATLLVFMLEYLKLWFKSRAMRRVVYGAASWVLFPARYLDWFLFRKGVAGQMGNHCFVWARKPEG